MVEFTPEIATLEPAAFVREYLEALGAESSLPARGSASAGERRRSRHDPEPGLGARAVPIVDGVSSTQIRTLVWTSVTSTWRARPERNQ